MTELEDRLQTHLEKLEDGQTTSAIRNTMQDEDEFGALVTLAAAVKGVEKPEMTPQCARSMRSDVLNHAQQARLKKAPEKKAWWRTPAFAGAFLILAFGVVAVTVFMAGLVWRIGFQNRQIVTFAERDGLVEINSTGETGAWNKVAALTQLETGSMLRTGPGSSATLRFADGSLTTLAANTEVVLTTLEKDGDTFQIELTQHIGKTTHQVSEITGELAYFLLNTPGGTARVPRHTIPGFY